MIRFFRSAQPISVRPHRSGLLLSLVGAFFMVAASASAQFGGPSSTQVHDASALKPPTGARVAIVEFADLECPACAHENPTLKAAASTYKIPWVRRDFLIPNHVWSPVASVNARWFDSKSKELGDEYRDQVFLNQSSIYSLIVLRQFTEKFAKSHGLALPFALDPQGKLAAAVKADTDLGTRIGVEHTPTVWIVTAGSKGAPYIEVTDQNRLYQIIDQALADTTPAKPAATVATKKTTAKSATKKPAGK
jgi:protein-disulfide isomerase